MDRYFIRPGPDGLAKVTRSRIGEGVKESWVVPVEDAELEVLREWARFHREETSYRPVWNLTGDA